MKLSEQILIISKSSKLLRLREEYPWAWRDRLGQYHNKITFETKMDSDIFKQYITIKEQEYKCSYFMENF